MKIEKCNYSYRLDDSDSIECEFAVHSDGKCILHCNKDDWNLPEKINHELDDGNYSSFVSMLRDIFSKNINTTNTTLCGVVFPKTENVFSMFLKDVKADKYSNGLLRVNSLHLKDCKFFSDTILEQVSNITLSNCTSTGSIIIGSNVQELNIDNKSEINEIMISGENRNYSDMKKLSFHSCKISALRINSIEFNTIIIDDSEIQNLTFERTDIHSYLKLRDNPVIKNAKFDIMLFDENSFAEIESCNFEDLTVNNCHAQPKYFSILNCAINKNMMVAGSELNKYVFDTVDMSRAKILMNNSNFMGNSFTKFNNVKWGEFILSKDIKNRDTFRQLKHVNDQQGNYIQANKFYSLEMEKYGEEISIKNFQDWFVFIISKNLSNFSQNWFLPILWFGFMSMFLFNILALQTISNLDYGDLWFPIGLMFSNFKWVFAIHFLFLIVCLFNSKNYYYILLKRLLGYANLAAFIGSITVYINVWGSFPETMISFEKFIIFANPLQFSLPDNYNWLYLVLMILHRLFTFVIGYHLVTALRFNTRRK